MRSSLDAVIANGPAVMDRRALVGASSAGALARAVNSGRVIRVLPGLYARPEEASSWWVRAQAALQWTAPGGVLAGEAALCAWGLTDVAPRRITVLAPTSTRRPCPEWLRIRRVNWTPRSAQRFDLTTLPLADAVIQAGVEPELRGDTAAVYRAVQRRLIPASDLLSALARAPRVAERATLERHIRAAVAGSESYLEDHARRVVFGTREFAHLVPQFQVVADGLPTRLDLYDRGARLAIECDGASFHAHPEAWQHDLDRTARLAAIGILTLRFSYRDLTRRPEWCRDMVRLAARERFPRVA